MNIEQIVIGTLAWLVLVGIVYTHCRWANIRACLAIWFKREYWTSYNIVDMVAWMAKGAIIVPGLIFGIQIWWLYFFALATSLALIWSSERKLQPTLVAFNTLWAGIACMVLAQHLIK